MRAGLAMLVLGGALLAGCGEDDRPGSTQPATTRAASGAAADREKAPRKPDPEPTPGTKIILGDSEFGEMLYGSNEQAIYVFDNDRRNETVCYGECAKAWPPVLTEGKPEAANGVDQSLLGEIERDDGSEQVTYAGQPLYFYAHEGPGEVRCHNVFLNGGYWWVVGPDGAPRA